ncbi:MAG: trypsin-like peptidase domain-containing protein, partial [Oscillospiraceae bacterium]|nr:trypsin-like peptidase domain-containing protein [Oscillospiraceae bacterium]
MYNLPKTTRGANQTLDNQSNYHTDQDSFNSQDTFRNPYANPTNPAQTPPVGSYPSYVPGSSGAYAVRPPARQQTQPSPECPPAWQQTQPSPERPPTQRQTQPVPERQRIFPDPAARPATLATPTAQAAQAYPSYSAVRPPAEKKPFSKFFLDRNTVVGMILGFAACAVIGVSCALMLIAARPNASNQAANPAADSVATGQTTPKTNTSAPIDEGDMLSYAQVAAKVRPSVVGVTLYANLPSYYGGGESVYSQGSGVVLTSDGYVVTNAHVIDNANYSKFKITVTVSDENHNSDEYLAAVVGYDTRTDLAVLKISAAGLTPAALGDSAALAQGDNVAALGNPGGAQFAGSISSGIVSGLDRVVDDRGAAADSAMRYIQTDAPINPGNSGGALVNMYGQVIGINSAKIVASGYEGLGFAIPINTAVPIINQLRENGSVIRPVLGITCAPVTEQYAAWYDVPEGLRIAGIRPDSDLV